jgi:DUF1365 family protein
LNDDDDSSDEEHRHPHTHASKQDTQTSFHPNSSISTTNDSNTPVPDVHFKASMHMHGYDITQRNLSYVLVAFPIQTIKIVFCIYAHAAVMFLWRKATVFGHPDPDVKFW